MLLCWLLKVINKDNYTSECKCIARVMLFKKTHKYPARVPALLRDWLNLFSTYSNNAICMQLEHKEKIFSASIFFLQSSSYAQRKKHKIPILRTEIETLQYIVHCQRLAKRHNMQKICFFFLWNEKKSWLPFHLDAFLVMQILICNKHHILCRSDFCWPRNEIENLLLELQLSFYIFFFFAYNIYSNKSSIKKFFNRLNPASKWFRAARELLGMGCRLKLLLRS